MSGTPTGSPRGVSYIVPALEEAAGIVPVLAALRALAGAGDEILVVDGGSRDGTAVLAAPWADRLLVAPRGRALQMNAAAALARGEWLVFVHADTRLGKDFPAALGRVRGASWAYARVRLDAPGILPALVGRGIDLRARLSGTVTGDQVIAVRREAFRALGGFPPVPLMEDILFSRRARALGRPVRLRATVLTSARRWQARGYLRTILFMWGLRLRHALGASPETLARRYAPVRT